MSSKASSVRSGKVIDDIRAIARDHGYAVAVHGSMRAINKLPYLWRVKKHDHDPPKPHGRLGFVWLIQLRHGSCPRYVDLSVIPRG